MEQRTLWKADSDSDIQQILHIVWNTQAQYDVHSGLVQHYVCLIIELCILLSVYQPVYVETSVRNKCRCSFSCALLTLHGRNM
jgi:hypothetical protein